MKDLTQNSILQNRIMICYLPNMPNFFYKYYSSSGLKKTLANSSLLWSSPILFNDPFDNQIHINFTDTTEELEEAIKNSLLDIIESENPDFSKFSPEQALKLKYIWAHCNKNEESKRTIKNNLEKNPAEMGVTKEELERQISELNTALAQELRYTAIFCITETNDNLLMWAHYANSHKGGVVKFLALKEVDSPLTVAKKVHYSDKIPEMKFGNFVLNNTYEDRKQVIDTFTLTKGSAWSYEKEWRIITELRNKTNQFEVIPFAKQEVGGLYLGCRISPEDKEELISIMNEKYPWAPIYQAHCKKEEFALYFEQIK